MLFECSATVLVVVYPFYWWTNDDKPHHFTQIQRNANRQLL